MQDLVSIVIVNWNGEKWLKKCLESLAMQIYKNIEIIFVDNASTDGSINFVKQFYPKIKIVINQKNLGFAGGNNIGVMNATGKYILLLNNDTTVNNDFLSILVDYLEKNIDVGIVQPKIYLTREKGLLDATGSFLTKTGFLKHTGFEIDHGQHNTIQQIFSAKGACILIRKEVIEKVGLFDDDYFAYFEETDFCWRTWLAGYKIIFLPQSIIYHDMGLTCRKFPSSFADYLSFKNRIRTHIKNLSFPKLIYILPVHLVITILFAIIYLVLGKFRNSYAVLKAWAWNIANLRKTLKKREKIQNEIRKISDKKLFPIIMQKLDVAITLNHLKRYLKRW